MVRIMGQYTHPVALDLLFTITGTSQVRHPPSQFLLRWPSTHLPRVALTESFPTSNVVSSLRVHLTYRLGQHGVMVPTGPRLLTRLRLLRWTSERARIQRQPMGPHNISSPWNGCECGKLESEWRSSRVDSTEGRWHAITI